MTKEQFRDLVDEAMETIRLMPDEVWESGYPLLRIRFKGSAEVVIVGIKEEAPEDDGCED